MATNREVAETIFKQLGAGRFMTMTGAHDFTVDTQALAFKIGRNSKAINYVKIALEADDTYTLTFYRYRKLELHTVSTATDIYADNLQRVFTMHTGMDTHL